MALLLPHYKKTVGLLNYCLKWFEKRKYTIGATLRHPWGKYLLLYLMLKGQYLC